MNFYEELQEEASEDGVDVCDYPFCSERIKGLYCDGTIAINKDLTATQKACILAEELGHHYTTVGNILDQSDPANRKQELKARLWAYNKQIGLQGIVRAYQHRCRNIPEMAEYLGVTESFLSDALELYRKKYGCNVNLDNYTIIFEPRLAVIERLH